jgi:cell division protein FtsZ
MNHQISNRSNTPALYLVVGIGSGACKAVMGMMDAQLPGAVFAVIDSDPEPIRVMAPVLGSRAIHWPRDRAPARLKSLARVLLADARLVIVVTALGGGTGSALAPYLARTAHEMGIPAIGVLTMPLDSEGSKRHRTAEDSLWALRQLLQEHVVIDPKVLLSSGRLGNQPMGKLFEAACGEMGRATADIAERRQAQWRTSTDAA